LDTLRLFPIMREGNLLITGRYTVEVVQACSGVRSLISLLALALAYGYLSTKSLFIRAILSFSVLPLAIVGNALRVCSQVMLAYYFGLSVTEGLWHTVVGLVGFFSAAGLLPVLHQATRTYASRIIHKQG
jgi:exosortase